MPQRSPDAGDGDPHADEPAPLASMQIAALLDCSRRPGRHPQVGDVTVRDILHEWVDHDREHLAQLTALTQRLVWPGMGNARRLSEPDA
jgi:hypothetical protein